MSERYRLIGSNGSPYSVKLRAVLRYRRISFDWLRMNAALREEVAHVKPAMVPVLGYPDGNTYRVDSTPLILDLERRHAERRVVPDDPGLAFIDHLLEDMADEWGTKLMFHYRWHDEADQIFASEWLARERMGPTGAAVEEAAKAFRARQLGRLDLVGVQPANRPVLVQGYRRVLAILERHLAGHDFILGGARPSLADFGWFGQLSQLATDPTPAGIMRATAPRVFAWQLRMDDQSGLQPGAWPDPQAPYSDAVMALLRMAGEIYLPYLLANARAVAAEAKFFDIELLGHNFTQVPFKYQVKCLTWLREELAALGDATRAPVERALREAGCWDALQS